MINEDLHRLSKLAARGHELTLRFLELRVSDSYSRQACLREFQSLVEEFKAVASRLGIAR